MGASKKLFNKIREVEECTPFNHEANFCKKVKENWLSDKDFTRLKSASLIESTQALIDKKMPEGYLDMVMELIDRKEPKYIANESGLDYIKLVHKTPIENMKRIFKKYDNLDFFISKKLRDGLEILILNNNG